MTPLEAAVEMATAALCRGVATIEQTHAAIARKPFAPLRLAPLAGEVSEMVRVVHDGISALAYAGVRGGLRATGGTIRLVLAASGLGEHELAAGSAGDLALSALNGFAGDRLADEGSPLAAEMSLRHAGRSVALQAEDLVEAFPQPSRRVAVFVHGLACNETLWWRHAERHYGSADVNYGSRLAEDLGYSPLYVRYNTGLHISDNGRRLSHLLDRLVAEWPLPVEELVLIGHSMGGLVIRSASHYGAQSAWAARARHLFFLGSPHLGAPLEKAANVAGWLLGLADVTRPIAEVVNSRSRGIKDLRFGALRDEDWLDHDLDALLAGRTGDVPFLDGAAHYFVAATVTRDRRHPVGIALGDLLVREASAAGRGRLRRVPFPLENGRHLGAIGHLDLLNHPDVYRQIADWLRRS